MRKYPLNSYDRIRGQWQGASIKILGGYVKREERGILKNQNPQNQITKQKQQQQKQHKNIC